MKYLFKIPALFVCIAILFGCADENPNLVNPVSLNKTVRIRLFNVAGDKNPRQLSVSGTKSQMTAYGSLSQVMIPPPSDSLVLQTYLNDQPEYTYPYKFKIIRDQHYIMFAAPKPGSGKPADSIVIVGSAFTKLTDTNHCFLSMVNVSNETGTNYSLAMGCPNSPLAFSPVGYLANSNEIEVPSGNFPVSILKSDLSGNKTTIGLFDLSLKKRGEYLIVVMGDTPDKISIISKLDTTASALQKLNLISSTKAYIRTINLSQNNISASRYPDDNFLTSLSSSSISDYSAVTACSSNYADSIIISSGGKFTSSLQTSLVVNFKYSMIVLDSANNIASKNIIVPNLRGVLYPKDNAVVRVVNLSEQNPAITLSMGARDDNSSTTGYRSGEVMATSLVYGRISNSVFVLKGRAPLTLFTASSPDRLLFTCISNFEAGKSYLVIISNDNNSNVRVNVMDEDLVNTSATNAEEGTFAQLANMTPGLDFAELKIDNVLNSAKLFSATSIATVLPIGDGNISIKSNSIAFNTKKDNRDLFVVAGTKNNPEMIHVQNLRMAYNNAGFNRRFLNAAADIGVLMIYDMDKRIDTGIKPIVVDLAYKSISEPYMLTLERKYSYFFYNQPANKLMKQINDISMTFGKNYTIIFGGDSTIISQTPKEYRYSILLLQEY